MGTYISCSDLVTRYDLTASWSGQAETLITYAEAELNQNLAPYFSVPFSPVPLIIKDLALDMAYCKALRSKDIKKGNEVCKQVYGRIETMQLNGYVTDSGTIVSPTDATNEIWSSTEDYINTHSMLDAENTYTHVDSNLLSDLENERT